MKILAIDSSSKTASVAVLEDETIINEEFLNNGLTHSQTLAPMVQSVMKKSNITSENIDMFAVTVGPGSFTGLRIGISLIKGMAVISNKPCVGVSSLQATILNYSKLNGKFYVCVDYRNGQLYNAVFEVVDGEIFYLIQDRAVNIETLENELLSEGEIVFLAGSSAGICYQILKTKNKNIKILPENLSFINASNVGYIALKKFKDNDYFNSEDLNPIYLRVSQAERMLSVKNNK